MDCFLAVGLYLPGLLSYQEMMHFQEETLYLAIHLLNRAVREIKVTTVNLQLLGMVCLFLAAKKEECLLPEVSWLGPSPTRDAAT